MATIHRYSTASGTRYEVRYRKPDGKPTRKRGFTRKLDADQYASTVEVSKLKGEYVAPSLGRESVGALAPTWLSLKQGIVKPAVYDKLESSWRIHVGPRWESTPVARVTKSSVQAWLNSIDKSPTVVRRCHGVLAGILDLAVDDGLLAKHPVRETVLPRKVKGAHAYLTPDQLHRFVDNVPPQHRLFAYTLATTGLRYGELAALQGKHIDRGRGRILVEQTMYYHRVREGEGAYGVGQVKTYERRQVPVFRSVLAQLPLVMPEALVFPSPTGRMRGYLNSKSWWQTALRATQAADPHFPQISPHDLRHTAASMAVSAGANVKAVQRMLGHASAAMTLDVYADLFDTDLDDVAARMEAMIVGK